LFSKAEDWIDFLEMIVLIGGLKGKFSLGGGLESVFLSEAIGMRFDLIDKLFS
jgi:hypothetical protein